MTRRAARRLARLCNEYAAGLMRKHPGRFGFFASVPLPDVDGAIAEAAYAFDTLKCDGIGVMGSVADRFLGDPAVEGVPLLGAGSAERCPTENRRRKIGRARLRRAVCAYGT